jgi:hypothetical protein
MKALLAFIGLTIALSPAPGWAQLCCVVSGKVVGEGSGIPLRGAKIEARLASDGQTPPISVHSGENGAFSLTLRPGSWRLTAARAGWFPSPRSEALVEVKEGNPGGAVRLELQAPAAVSGVVLDAYGEPLQGLPVQVFQRMCRAGEERIFSAGQSLTDDRGAYRIHSIPEGSYIIYAAHVSQSQEPRYEGQFFPAVADFNAAVPVTLQAGLETSNVDFRLREAKLGTLRVQAEAGLPWLFTLLKVSGGVYEHIAQQPRRDPGGWYVFERLPLGEYAVAGYLPGRGEATPRGGYALARLGREGEVAEVVLDEIGVANLQGAIRCNEACEGLAFDRLELQVYSRGVKSFVVGASAAGARVRLDGTFRLSVMPLVDYLVKLQGLPGDLYVTSVKVEGQSPRLDHQVTHTGSNAMVEVNIGRGAATLEVNLQGIDAQAASRGVVQLLRAGVREPIETVQVDRDRRAVFRNLAPGEYRVAWMPPNRGCWKEGERDAAVTSVRLAAGEQASVKLKVGE